MRAVLLALLMGCGQTVAAAAREGEDAGADASIEPAATADATTATDSGSVDADPDAGSEVSACNLRGYRRNDALPKTDDFAYEDTGCDLSCGAGGGYRYRTKDAGVAPGIANDVCRQQIDRDVATALWCCGNIVCTRDLRPEKADLCKTYNPGHPAPFICAGPSAGPMKAGCVAALAPDATSSAFCCDSL